MWTIRRDQRGVSNIIVVVLGLVIIVIITSNVILWSYEMNQLDWEKMREDIAIVDITCVTEVWSYNPSGYTLEGSTSLVSGSVSNLTADDSVHMTFRSYYSADTSDFVDNNICDVDLSPDIGSHSNFTAQQYGPDNIFDVLTEENTAGAGSGDKTNSPSSYANKDVEWIENGGSNSAYSSDDGYAGQTSTVDRGCDYLSFGFDIPSGATINGIEVSLEGHRSGGFFAPYKFSAQLIKNGIEVGDEKVVANDYGWFDSIQTVGGSSDRWGTSWIRDDVIASNFGVRVETDTSWIWGGIMYLDHVYVKVYYSIAVANYELDLEIQWTSVDYDETNEELCIYAGDMGSEDLRVDYWTGSAWGNLLTDLTANSWNNVSVSLTSTTFAIRSKGGNETGDTTQDSWNIDVALLHVWSDEYISEVEFTGLSNTEDWTQLSWTIDSAWTISSVDVTLQLYNYTLNGYSTSGNGYMSHTSSATANTDETKNQTITVNPTHFRNATGYWKMKVKGVKSTDTQFDFKADWIEFKVVKAGGTSFTFESTGSLTCHLVSLWVVNSTVHQHYDIDVFINSGDTYSYVRDDIDLSQGQITVKVVTERGNIAVYSGS